MSGTQRKYYAVYMGSLGSSADALYMRISVYLLRWGCAKNESEIEKRE